jgi:hypothetical protein
VWLDFWEEATELVLTVAIGFFLLTFRQQLGLGRNAPAPKALEAGFGVGAPKPRQPEA